MAISRLKEAKDLAEKFNRITNDLDRINFIKANNDALGVSLDNDHTGVRFLVDEEVLEEEEVDLISNIELDSFDNFCGDDDLTYTLFEALGIEAEGV